MAYTRKTYRFRNAIEREEYHSGRYGAPGEKRRKKENPTPEQMEKVNQRNREKMARRRLRKYFRKEDLFVTLTYAPEKRPADMEAAKEDFRRFVAKIKPSYRKLGTELRWIRNIERGTRNAWHIHLVVNRIPDADLTVASAWAHGTVDLRPCHTAGEFRKLAGYLTKTPKTESRLKESSYSSSRNMPLPEPEKREVTRWDTWEEGEVRVPKGFYLDKESYHEGINPVTGFRYREYTLLRVKEKEDRDAEGGHIHRHDPAGVRKRRGERDVHHADPAGRGRRPRAEGGGGD